MFETLEILRDHQVATIWMNRPDRHNAFNAQVIAELTQAFELLGADQSARVIVLAGCGKSFSAGADLNWMKAAGEASFEDNVADARKLAAMLRRLAEMPKPTIARVQGAALGGGMGLAAACDICFAATAASFATSEVKFGLIPSAIGPYVLRAIGARQASRYFLSAERICAKRAVEIGLAHEVVRRKIWTGPWRR
jgi:methylglutaconyl-CoA hydratase